MPNRENPPAANDASISDAESDSKLRFVEDIIFFVVRLLLLIVLTAAWLVLGGIFSAWIIFRVSVAYSVSVIAGILHGGRDSAGSIASLRPAVGIWPQGFEQIFRSLDPRKKPTAVEVLPFSWSKVAFESACAFLFIVAIVFAEVVISMTWGTFIVGPQVQQDRLLSESQSQLRTLTAQNLRTEKDLVDARAELQRRTFWRAAKLSNKLNRRFQFYRFDDGKWLALESDPDNYWKLTAENSDITVKFYPKPSSPERQINLKTSLFDRKPSNAERLKAPNNYFWQKPNGEIEIACDE